MVAFVVIELPTLKLMEKYAEMLSSTPLSKLAYKFKNGGYTIIELAIVVAIMAVLVSVGAANYRDFQRRQYLESAVSMVEADIKLARQLALSGRYFVGCDQLDGYEIRIYPDDDDSDITEPDENKYYIGALCDTNKRCQNNPVTHCIKQQELPEGIIISSTNTTGFQGNRALFLTVGRGIDQSNDAILTLSFPGTGVPDRQITIFPSGVIEIN